MKARTSQTKSKSRKTTRKPAKLSQISREKEGFVTSYDGTKIWYKSMGKGTPIIFCNGLGCSTFYWKHIQSYFKKEHQVIIFDWRGHGKSNEPANDKNIHLQALREDLFAVFKALKIKKAILAGHSMGTQVLYEFYAKYPKKVSALIPICGSFGKPIDTFYNIPTLKYAFAAIYFFNHTFPGTANKISSLIAKNPFWFQVGSLLQMMNPGLADKKVLKEYIEHITSVDPILFAKMIKSMQKTTAESQLKNIKVPSLIIAGDHDKFTPLWLSKKTHHLIPKSEILIVRKASHVALIEQPALINLRIEKFLHERL
jgi:pimeloyl-ACP methyl ester carboxylesterase